MLDKTVLNEQARRKLTTLSRRRVAAPGTEQDHDISQRRGFMLTRGDPKTVQRERPPVFPGRP